MHSLTKIVLISIALWWVLLVALFLFPHVVPIVSGFAILLSLPVALVLLILSLIALIKDKKRIWPAVCVVLVVLVTYVALRQIMFLGARANLYLHHQHYETIANRVLSVHTDSEQKQICGDECWVMASNRQVAFHYIHGFLNWHDIVYDPSGTIMTPTNKDQRLQIDTYFGYAEHLTGNWYLCHFAD
jgi:hypothetical protein